jgi:hypothetical protein
VEVGLGSHFAVVFEPLGELNVLRMPPSCRTRLGGSQAAARLPLARR